MFRFRVVAAVALLASVSAPVLAQEAAKIVATRSAQTPRGATRVVFETNRAVEYLSHEVSGGLGYEIHLLDVDGTTLPSPLSTKGGFIGGVTFRGSANGVVASLTGATRPLRATTFTLPDPPRVVVDLHPDRERDAASAPKRPQVVEVAPARKGPSAAPSMPKLAEGPTAPGTGPDEERETTDPKPVGPEDQDFEDLLVWLHALQSSVDALNATDEETERARYRRRLGYLLVQRGILAEGENALRAAIQGHGRDTTTAVADSIALAEIRVQMGKMESAAEIARAIETRRAAPSERVRVAEVLLETGQPTLAISLLQNTQESLTGQVHAEATLLLARAYRATGHTAKARDSVRRLTANAATPGAMMPSALLLHADCEFALGRAREAKSLYERAAAMKLPDEDASWAGLQLGNLARRAGHLEQARRHWKHAADSWPDTFFASQAAWFLRVSETVQRVNDSDAVQGRG